MTMHNATRAARAVPQTAQMSFLLTAQTAGHTEHETEYRVSAMPCYKHTKHHFFSCVQAKPVMLVASTTAKPCNATPSVWYHRAGCERLDDAP